MLDGPRLPARSGKATSLVVLLHGYGADGRDLVDLGEYWAPLLPDTVFASPHAPEPMGAAPVGRQWFGYVERDDSERWTGVQRAQAALDGFLDAELARLGLDGSRLALVGFSQGTMMALHTGLRRKVAPAGIVGFSGIHVLPSPRDLAAFDAAIIARPPILLIHGDADTVVAPEYLPRAVESLQQRGIEVRAHMTRGLGHGIDRAGLTLAGNFLQEVLA